MKSEQAMNERLWHKMNEAIVAGATWNELCRDYGFIRTQLVWQALDRDFGNAGLDYLPEENYDLLHGIYQIIRSNKATMVSIGKVFRISQGIGHRTKPFVSWEHTILPSWDSCLQTVYISSCEALNLDFREGKSPHNRLDLCQAVRSGILRDKQGWLADLIKCRMVSLTVQVTPVLEADMWSDSYSLCVWDRQAKKGEASKGD